MKCTSFIWSGLHYDANRTFQMQNGIQIVTTHTSTAAVCRFKMVHSATADGRSLQFWADICISLLLISTSTWICWLSDNQLIPGKSADTWKISWYLDNQLMGEVWDFSADCRLPPIPSATWCCLFFTFFNVSPTFIVSQSADTWKISWDFELIAGCCPFPSATWCCAGAPAGGEQQSNYYF